MLTVLQGVLVLILSMLKATNTQYSDIYIPETTEGELCIIPFVYRNTLHHDCIREGRSRPWCFTDKDLTKWDFCKPHPVEFKNCKLAKPNVTIADIKEILDEHNAFRSKLPALRMRKLSWNTELAQKAQVAAESCKHDHWEVSLCGDRESSGQNLYYSYNAKEYPDVLSWKNVIHEWSHERKFYNMKTGKCQNKKLCGHFRQVAWDRSYLIGCGKAACHGKLNGKILYSIQYYCNYHHAGNIGDDRPYVESNHKSCQDCHYFERNRKFRCNKQNLCETCSPKNITGCVGYDDFKKHMIQNDVCMDTDFDCQHNADLCEQYHAGAGLPPMVIEYLQQCKKTCNMCT